MSYFDTNYVRAERAYRASQIREQIVGRRQASRLRKERVRRKRYTTAWEE